MSVRSPLALLVVLPSVVVAQGCGKCPPPVPWLVAKECPDDDSNSGSNASTSATMMTDSMTDGSSTTAGTMSASGSGSGSESGTESSSDGSTTSQGMCGDGVKGPSEECDDGNMTPGDGCENDCTNTSPFCGNAILEDKEECDDGNKIETDACLSTCKEATCGDMQVQAGVEVCDDGVNDGSYGTCAPGCEALAPHCGDGQVNDPSEECDDGNRVDDDLCQNDCIAAEIRYAFVTSTLYKGNLGGVTGADGQCKFAAMQADNLGGMGSEWVAWLSAPGGLAKNRLGTGFAGWYVLPTQPPTLVAHGWADLADGTLDKPINVDAGGTAVAEPLYVWSNTTISGESAGDSHCNSWTENNDPEGGRIGIVGETDLDWTDDSTGLPATCGNSYRLYCFQKK